MFDKVVPIIDAKQFILGCSLVILTKKEISRVLAFLRAKGIVFYDPYSHEHCIGLDELLKMSTKLRIVEALNYAIKPVNTLSNV